jgi:hypothetical protein
MKLELNQTNLFNVSIILDKLKYTRLINNKAVTIELTVDTKEKAINSLQAISSMSDGFFIECSQMSKRLETIE